MKQAIDRRKCDNCGKVEDCVMRLGPPPFAGWLSIQLTTAPAGRIEEMDYCSKKCAIEHLKFQRMKE